MIKTLYQLIRFSIVGLVVTLADFIVFTLLITGLHVGYLWAQGIAFITATVLNYVLSMRYVFKSKSATHREKINELMIFFMLSIIGGGLNMLLLYLSVEKFQLSLWVSKILVTGIVMLFNFISRKLILDQS